MTDATTRAPASDWLRAAWLTSALPFAYMLGIYALSSVPGNLTPEDSALLQIFVWTPPAVQNVLHIPLYGGLAWLWYRALTRWSAGHWLAALAALLLGAGYGVFDEWHQSWVPGRLASLTDVVLNTAGVVAALAWISIRHRRAGGSAAEAP